jgi:hypothetical protein
MTRAICLDVEGADKPDIHFLLVNHI